MLVLKAQPQQRVSYIIHLPVCQLPVHVYWVQSINVFPHPISNLNAEYQLSKHVYANRVKNSVDKTGYILV